VASCFGEEDSNNQFFAGVGICPGYDISRCMSRFTTPYMVNCDVYDTNDVTYDHHPALQYHACVGFDYLLRRMSCSCL